MSLLDPRTFRDYGQQYVDQHYGYGFCDRCGGTCREFDCLTAETMIWTERGAVPIPEIAVGDLVWSYNDGALALKPVTRLIRKPASPIYKVRTTRRTVRATADHPFLAMIGSPNWFAKGIEWRTVNEGLKRGDGLAVLGEAPFPDDAPPLPQSDRWPAISPTIDLFWLLGVIVADGHVTTRGASICVFGEQRERVRRVAIEVFHGFGLKQVRSHEYEMGHEIGLFQNGTSGLNVNGQRVAEFLSTVLDTTLKGPDKRVPDLVWSAPRKYVEAFLEGLMFGDGSVQNGRSYAAISYGTASERLAREVRSLYAMLGVATSQLREQRRTKPITIKGKLVKNARPMWWFEIYPESKRRSNQATRWSRRVLDVPFRAETVQEVTPDGSEETWDLTVADSHSFIADGLVVHNCSGLQCHISNGVGLTRNLCTTSFVMAQQCSNLGLEMTWDEAIADSGPDVFWAFHGADHGRVDDGSRPNGASGHIVCVVRVRDQNGHTTAFYTIEAMGRAYGCVNGQFFGRSPGWSGVYRIPGVSDRPPAPPIDPHVVARLIELDQWRHRCYGKALKLGDRSGDVLILNRELRNAHYLSRFTIIGNAFGPKTRDGNYKLKFAHPALGNTDGTSFGGPAADILVAMVT